MEQQIQFENHLEEILAGIHDLIAATRSLSIPTLVVHGDRDDVISVSEAYLAQKTNPQGVAGDHMFSRPEEQEQVDRTVAGWFRRPVD